MKSEAKEFAQGCWGTELSASGVVALLEIDTENSRDREKKNLRRLLCAKNALPL